MQLVFRLNQVAAGLPGGFLWIMVTGHTGGLLPNHQEIMRGSATFKRIVRILHDITKWTQGIMAFRFVVLKINFFLFSGTSNNEHLKSLFLTRLLKYDYPKNQAIR